MKPWKQWTPWRNVPGTGVAVRYVLTITKVSLETRPAARRFGRKETKP